MFFAFALFRRRQVDDPETGEGVWQCPECQNAYDRDAIERELLETVKRRSMAYQLQDLVCSKCRMVKMDNMSRMCTCSGLYSLTQKTSSFGTAPLASLAVPQLAIEAPLFFSQHQTAYEIRPSS